MKYQLDERQGVSAPLTGIAWRIIPHEKPMSPDAQAVLQYFKRHFISPKGAVSAGQRIQAVAHGMKMTREGVALGLKELVEAGFMSMSEDNMGAVLTPKGKHHIGVGPAVD
ncbi:hypothetical protein [Variovorax gossypii]